MTHIKTETVLDNDQELILAVYSMYTHESNHTYLQYTAACALFYYLTQKGFFNYNLNELLVYDYKESRRYIWEAKKFMADINVIRDHDLLIRARSRSRTYRDVNAHQCSDLGHEYIDRKRRTDKEFHELTDKVRQTLSSSRGELYDVKLADKGPLLVVDRGAGNLSSRKPIQGFLRELCSTGVEGTGNEQDCVDEEYQPFFI